jgi:hypothetical protein
MYFPIGAAFGLLVIIVWLVETFGGQGAEENKRACLVVLAGFLLLMAFLSSMALLSTLLFDI